MAHIQVEQAREALASAAKGHRISIAADEAEAANIRALGQPDPAVLHFVIPRERPLDLLFFRLIFTDLRTQVVAPDGKEQDEYIPIEAFQRALERLFYILRDPQGFDASVYDQNGNRFVGWGEFCFVFKKRQIIIRMSMWERIYLTLDNPESSKLAMIVSNIVLLTIVVSSLCFILSTVPECQNVPGDDPDGMPTAKPIFGTIEHICLAVFVVEYLLRLATCWGVRSEVFNEAELLALTTGYDMIHLPRPYWRIFKFVSALPNLIDLAAILPGVIGLMPGVSLSGGGFVVLRLVRLTRIFRAFRTIRGPAVVIARTLKQSTKALYVLAFNLMLGIVIAGSLMWLAEGGTWDRATRTYLRKTGVSWDPTKDSWEDEKSESPFQSIPHTFWWAIVTVTTVGYGDHYPTTSLGYVIAVATMVFSLVILALPVGVIGGTFGAEWETYEKEKKDEETTRQREMSYIISAFQRLNPSSLSHLMLVEVWNERFPEETKEPWGQLCSGDRARPHPAEFLGRVRLELELPSHAPVTKELTRPLTADPDTVRRAVSGSITLRYEWTPETHVQAVGKLEDLDEDARYPVGTLNVTLVCCEHLLNLNCSNVPHSASNPYCIAYCYPCPPAGPEELIQPCVWRSPTVINSLNPLFQVSHMLEFRWLNLEARVTQESSPCELRCAQRPAHEPPRLCLTSKAADAAVGSSAEAKINEFLHMMRDFASELGQVRSEVSAVSSRVDQLTLREPEPQMLPQDL